MVERPPRVAVVIPSWNSVDDLRCCLRSLSAQVGVELELIVIDNGSVDGSVEYLRETGTPHIQLPRNLGFAAAVNLGFQSTVAEAVMALNSDTVLEPDSLRRLTAALFTSERTGGVQPRILTRIRDRDQSQADPDAVIYSLGQALTADGRAREIGQGLRQGVPERDHREIFGVCGAACLFRRQMLEMVGGYDARYFAFYEDVDLNVRARIQGWRFRLAPDAVVWHVGNASWHAGFERPDAENAKLVARNRIWTQAKYMPWTALPRIAVVELGAMLRAIGQRRLLLTTSGKVSALSRLPELMRYRRALRRSGNLELAQEWLGESRRGLLASFRRDPSKWP